VSASAWSPRTALLLCAATQGLGIVVVEWHPALFERALGSAYHGLTALFATCALGALVLAARARKVSFGAGHVRAILYGAVALAVAHVVGVERFHPEVGPILLALLGVWSTAAMALAPAVTVVVPTPLLRAVDLLCLAICALLITAECGLRFLAVISPSPWFQTLDMSTAQRTAALGPAPGALHFGYPVNSRRFYDVEWRRHQPSDGRPRIACIGDSFSASVVPHPYHYTTVCEGMLQNIDIDNIGVCSAGPWDYVEWVRQASSELEPDAFVVAVFVGNDLHEAKRPTSRLSHALIHRDSVLLWLLPQRFRARSGAATDGLLAPAAPSSGPAEAKALTPEQLAARYPWIGDFTKEPATFDDAAYRKLEVARAVEACGNDTVGYLLLRRALREARVAARGRPFGVLLIPDEFQVEDLLWSEVVRAAKAPLDRDRPQRDLTAWLATEGIPYRDALPAFRAAAVGADGRKHLYHRNDTHWNVAGNRLGAAELAELAKALLAR